MASSAKKSINAFIKSDRAIVLLCFVMALIAWLVIKLNKEYSQDFVFPITFEIEENLTFSAPPPTQVKAQMRAKGWTLTRLAFRKKDTLAIVLDNFMAQTLGARQSLEDNFNALNIDQAEIEVIYPEQLHISLAEKQAKRVPIRINGQVELAPQHQLRDLISVVPDSITIWGPKAEIDSILYWNTIVWPFDPLQEDLTTTVSLVKSKPSLIQLEKYECEIIIPVEEITEKELVIPINIVDSLLGKIQIFPEVALLRCTVGLTKFDQIHEDQFTLMAIPDGNSKKWKVELVKQPDQITRFDFSPKSVEYFRINP